MNSYARLALLGGALALSAGPAGALEVYLAAKPFAKSLPMSGAAPPVEVPMWGYVSDADNDGDRIGDCFQAADNAARAICIDGLPAPTLPGPRIDLPAGETSLTVHLSNGLPQPTSIVIPGQALPTSNGAGPTWSNGAVGDRGGDLARKMRSYGSEAAPSGGSESYTWTLARSGTFMYHSGTWPQLQVYMGLYGALTKDFAAGQVQDGVAYDNEVLLFYSDVDPAHNAAVAAGEPDYTPIHYRAQWFLVNGEPYEDGVTEDIPAGAVGGTTLLRLLSAASETHVPTLQGLYMTLHNEDGFRYAYQNGSFFGGYAPREQYTAELPPLKTKDAIVTAPATAARIAVYDGNGYMTNPSDPEDFNQGDELGGMLRFLSFSANTAPVVTAPTPDPLSVAAAACATGVPSSNPTVASWLASATATDAEDGALPVTNNAPVELALGDTPIVFTATDSGGLSGTASATVSVTGAANTAPAVTAPAALGLRVPAGTISVPSSRPDIASWLASATATDAQDGPLSVANNAPADLLPGDTLVTFTAIDRCGLPGSASSALTLTVNSAPVVTVADRTNAEGDSVNLPIGATDADSDPLSFAATGLPPGLTIDTASGVVSGIIASGASGASPYNVSIEVGDGIDTTTAPFSWTVTAGTAPVQLYLSFSAGVTLNGTSYADEDILSWNGTAYAVVFDGSDIGLGGADIDAFAVIDGSTVLISFDGTRAAGTLPGIPASSGTIDDSDIVQFTGTLGPNTAGSFSLYFDGSDVGLTTDAEDVDGVEPIPGGLLISIGGDNQTVTGVADVDEEDLILCGGFSTIAVPGASAGVTTSCTWSRYFDGSDVGLTNGSEDIDSAALSGSQLFLSTSGGYAVTGLSGDENDVFVCNGPTTVPGGSNGVTTSCSGGFSPAFNIGTGNVDAIDRP